VGVFRARRVCPSVPIIDGNKGLEGQVDEAWFRLKELLKRAKSPVLELEP